MQRTVGPCHRDRKQKRNEKREERERDSTAGGEGGGEVAMSTPYRAAQVSARYRRGQSSSLAAAPFCPSR